MHLKLILRILFVIALLAGFLPQAARVSAAPASQDTSSQPTASDLILAMNTLRVSNGLPALIIDPIVNAVAQATADYMAANLMTWHIGDVRGRLAAAGYGGGATVWATENFAVGTTMTLDTVMLAWSDFEHMRPAVTPAYCHVGAGVSRASNGQTYYILQAAYTSENSCGPYTYPESSTGDPGVPLVSQLIVPVKVALPDAQGRIYHEVAAGQSLWSIAVAYKITIQDLEIWNNLERDVPLWVGQRLFIPSSSTAGYATPTPVGMIVPSTPDADGKVVHTVAAYQNLTTISQAYDISVKSILALNGLQEDWVLQVGQRLLISPGRVTPSPTPRPLTPLQKLTPSSDGRYYHVVQSGETLLWIAGLYELSVAELTAWNGLTADAIIRPEQKLLLLVTPPPTATATPAPSTATPTPTRELTATPLPPTHTPAPSPTPLPVTAADAPDEKPAWAPFIGLGVAVISVAALIGYGVRARKKR
jgi:LysM repeat protein